MRERLAKIERYVESTGVIHAVKEYVMEAHFHFRNPPQGKLRDTLALMGLIQHPDNPNCMVLTGLTRNISEKEREE